MVKILFQRFFHVILLRMSVTVASLTFDELKVKWPEFRESLKVPFPFITPDWLEAWWTSFHDSDELFLRAVYAEAGIIGIAALRINQGIARFVGSANVSDYLDLIVKQGSETEFLTTILNEIQKAGIKKLELESLRPDSTVMRYLVPIAKSNGNVVEIVSTDVSLDIALPATWDSYLASLTTHQRHEIGRKLRRLEEAGGIRFDIKPPQDTPSELATLIKLLKISRSDKAEFMTVPMEAYFNRLGEAMNRIRILRFGHLRVGETIVASVLCFDYNETRYLYNSGYDPQYSSLSVGLLSKVYSIKNAIENKMTRYDFLKGAETYKYHLGGIEMPISHVRIELC